MLTTPPTRQTTRKRIGVQVVLARARARLTQAELARAAGVTRQTVSGIERGSTNATVDVLDQIANALSIPIARLFTPARDLTGVVDADEISRRRASPRTELVSARALHAAIDEVADSNSKA